ncbi:IS66 family insertion sequence element accessory protein TnpA [Cerasicoccus maritimus]|uniref:IS66 family insertion sequence element accessory protein TnpA n=1 Tax=Cerasicoccus maritimus TaxID=490089 RepID=UPI002852C3DB|nr:hypothetical protein [Cerasicoccus maritimus]
MDVEIVDSGLKRDSVGRRIESDAERERLLEAYDVSGQTQRAFAEQHGLAYNTLVYWLKLRRHKEQAAGAGSKSVSLFHEVSLPSVSPSLLEVCLPDGMVLRGGDAESLAALAKALRC